MRNYKIFQRNLAKIKPNLLFASIILNIGIFTYSAVIATSVRGILNYIGQGNKADAIGDSVWICLLSMFLGAVVRSLCIKGSSYLDSLRGYYYKESLRINMMKSFLHNNSMKELSANAGRLLERMDDDIPSVTFPVELLTEVSGYIIYTIIAIGSLILINWKITIFVFIPLSVGIFIIKRLTEKLQKSRNANRSMHDTTTIALSDAVSSVMMIKALGEQKSILRFYDNTNENRRKTVLKDNLFQNMVNMSVDISSIVGIAAIMLAVVSLMRNGEFPIGDFAIFIVYLGTLNDCIVRILELVTENKKAEVSFNRMVKYVPLGDLSAKLSLTTSNKKEITVEPYYKKRTELETLKTLSVENLTCLYEDKRGVRNVNFKLNMGEIIAVKGKVASGKSSMVYALTGAKEYEEGTIMWNNRILSREEAIEYPYVSVALQNGNLLNETIRFNLTLGKGFSDEDIMKVLQICCMYEEVYKMPCGLDTIVGENGVLLSGGQRQRLLFARMLLIHPMLYIIDNATSALDEKTEDLLYQNFKKIVKKENAAAIIINDRDAATNIADRLLTI